MMKNERLLKLHFLVPGSIKNRTGGTIYDRRIIEGLEKLGINVKLHEVSGNFPYPDVEEVDSLSSLLEKIPDNSLAIIDGLILGVIPKIIKPHSGRLKIIALIHHPLCDETGFDDRERIRLLERESRSLKSVSSIMVTSIFTSERMRELELVEENHRITVVEPGADPSPLSPEHVPGETLKLISIGAVTKRKSHQDLLSALSTLKELDWNLICMGSLDQDREYAEETLKMVEKSGLSDRVIFTGEVSEQKLKDIIQNAHLLVHPSRYEGYGMVITEAISRGIPVLSSSGGALKFTLPEGAGILHEPGNVQSLNKALSSILKDEVLYSIIRKGAERAREEIRTWDQAAAEFKIALEEM